MSTADMQVGPVQALAPRGELSSLKRSRANTAAKREPKVFRMILLQTLLCTGPAMLLVALRQPFLGAYWLYGSLGIFLVWDFISGKLLPLLTLIISVVPVVMLLRSLFVFSLPLGIAAFAFGWAVESGTGMARLRASWPLKAVLCAGIGYWWLSYLVSGDYSSNLRVLEMLMMAGCVYMLGKHQQYLATAIAGMGISILVMGLAMAQFGDRLGKGHITDDVSLGNPIVMGTASALVLLCSISHGGKWVHTGGSNVWRFVLLGISATCLVMSTSRGSWLTALAGLVILMIFVPAERKQLLGILAVLACVIAMVVASGRGKFVTEYFDKATDDDRSFSKKTSGRSDQWEIVSKLLQDSPLWGFGVASGRKGALYYGGHDLVWHSLYLHLGAEGGWLFLSAALIFLSNLIKHGYRFLRRTGQILPLMATVCYMVIGVSVNTFDWMSGVYFGLAILGTGPWVSAQRTIQTPRRRQIQLSEPAT